MTKTEAKDFITAAVLQYFNDSEDLAFDLERLVGADKSHWRELANALEAIDFPKLADEIRDLAKQRRY